MNENGNNETYIDEQIFEWENEETGKAKRVAFYGEMLADGIYCDVGLNSWDTKFTVVRIDTLHLNNHSFFIFTEKDGSKKIPECYIFNSFEEMVESAIVPSGLSNMIANILEIEYMDM